MKKKDILYCILFVIGIISIIGLLIAWNDGYLEGTILENILGMLFPALLVSYGLLVSISFWLKKIGVEISGKSLIIIWLILVIVVIVILNLPLSDATLTALTLICAGIIMFTLIVFVISEWIKKK